MINYSIKQILRSRGKTGLFFIFLMISAVLLYLGIGMWNINQKNMKEFEKIFTTIGTIQQKQKDSALKLVYDEYTGKMTCYRKKNYGEKIKDSQLLFEGADYIIEPKQRPYFGADMENVSNYSSIIKNLKKDYFTAEFVLLENYDGTKPVTAKITRSFAEEYKEGTEFSFFHYEDIKLEKDKKYIASFSAYMDIDNDGIREFCLGSGLASTQYDENGEKIESEYDEILISEVQEEFYKTRIGKCWEEQAKSLQKRTQILPVTPVEDVNLIMPFYEKQAYVIQGRLIEKNEYKEGKNVCLIPQYLAKNMYLKVGDTLKLSLLYASYGETPEQGFSFKGGGFSSTLLNAEGKQYKIFDEQTYEIVGIYDMANNLGEYALSPVEVFIPYKAVKESWENNIISTGFMKNNNTSFQIENGRIHEFLNLWNQQEFATELEVTFYDKGYTKYVDSIENRKKMSCIFMFSGGLLSVTIIFFFSNLYITQQREKITIERIMGLTKKKTVYSFFSGLCFVAVTAIGIGCLTGRFIINYMSEKIEAPVVYDSLFSVTQVQSLNNSEMNAIGESGGVFLFTFIIILISVFTIFGLQLYQVLKDQPLKMLSKLQD